MNVRSLWRTHVPSKNMENSISKQMLQIVTTRNQNKSVAWRGWWWARMTCHTLVVCTSLHTWNLSSWFMVVRGIQYTCMFHVAKACHFVMFIPHPLRTWSWSSWFYHRFGIHAGRMLLSRALQLRGHSTKLYRLIKFVQRAVAALTTHLNCHVTL